MEKLSQILWRERELLDTLIYKLEQEQLVLANGRTRWLMRSAREVEKVLTTIRETEILRSIAADQVAASLGLSANPSLLELSEACVEPWRSILVEHYDAFLTVIGEITVVADANRDLVAAAHRSAADPAGSTIGARTAVQLADVEVHQAAYQASLAATARVMQPSLLDFLR